ncbi:MAG TPA: hypothetical protein PK400_03910 [Phycisphaerales bacterium]|nr:hypothetical protein [Phycisphaerales bacterium]HRQ76845.1 hypothetical protein [Phycisphaerales bacterium]
MRVVVDGRECDVDLGSDSVAKVIAACAAIAERDGRMIVDIVVDGASWTAEDVEACEREGASAQEVILTTAEPHALVSSMFGEAADALTDACSLQEQAAELLQADQKSDAMQSLNESLGIWVSVQQAVSQGTSLLGMSLDDLTIEGTPAEEVIQRLEQQLHTLFRQLEADDTVGLADTLLYEMPDVAEQWRGLLHEMRRRLASLQQ